MMRALIAVCGVAATACLPVSGGIDGGEVEVRFAAMVGDAGFACGQTYTLGSTGTAFRPRDLRFYVSELSLTPPDAGTRVVALDENAFQGQGVAMLDFENRTGECSNGTEPMHTSVTGIVAGAGVRELRFTIGVPFALNHQDATTALPPLDSSALFWSWAAGYRFLRLEGTTTGLPNGYSLHVGSTQCLPGAAANSVERCDAPNRTTVVISGFDPATDVVVLDLAKLFEGSNLDENAPNTAPGCMSEADDPDCAPIFARLGISDGGQSVFGKQR